MTGGPRRYRRRRPYELAAMPEAILFRELLAARAANCAGALRDVLAEFAKRREPDLRRFIAGKVPAYEVADILSDVQLSIQTSAFDKPTIGHLVMWTRSIAHCRCVDFYRRRSARPQETSLPDHDHASEITDGPSNSAKQLDALVLDIAEARVRRSLRADHRMVIVLHRDHRFSAKEVAEIVPGISPDNVAKINERYLTKLRADLGEDFRATA